MGNLETVKDFNNYGRNIAVAFRMSGSNRRAASEFYQKQNEGPELIGPIACEENDEEKKALAVQILGEFRTKKSVPYLRDITRSSVSNDIFYKALTALFRTESYNGHKILRNIWLNTQDMKLNYFQGWQSNISWLIWSTFRCNYPYAEKQSDDGVYYFNNGQYGSALLKFSDAIGSYPYFSDFWRQMGDTKIKISQEKKQEDIDVFCKHWNIDKESSLEELKYGGIKDLDTSRDIVPFLPNSIIQLGYSYAKADQHMKAQYCYDYALSFDNMEDINAYAYFMKAESFEKSDGKNDSINYYKMSKELYEKCLEKKYIVSMEFEAKNMIARINEKLEK